MATPTKIQVVALAKQMYMKHQAKHSFEGIEDSQPEMVELLEEGWIKKAQETLQATSQIERELKQYERYVESFKSDQSSTEKLKSETIVLPSMLIPFNLKESLDTGFFACGTSQSGKTTLCKHLVKTLVNEGISVYVIDVSKAWTVDTPISNVITVHPCDNVDVPANQSAIIDLAQLCYTERVNYVIAFCQALYDWHKKFGFKRAPFEFIFFEEAHIYFPNGCFRSPRKFSPCIDIVTVGANFNLRFGAITQFPAMLDKALVKITQQRYFGFTTENNDLNYIKGFVGKEHTNRLNKDGTPNQNSVFNLQKGQFLYQLRSKIEKIQSSPYEQPKADFTLNGQTVSFGYKL